MKKLFLLIVLSSCVSLMSDVSYAGYAEGNAFSSGNTNTTPAQDAYGQVVRIVGGSRCKATAAPPSYSEGDEVPLSCELDGDLRTNGAGGGGAGDASLAEQQTQTGILTTMDADTGAISLGVGGTADAAATAGSTGSLSAKLRTVTSQLDILSAAAVRTLTVASGVTTNTTSTPIAGVRGTKTYWAQVDGTGAVTATVQFNGCQTAATTYCVVLGSIALSGTTQKYDVTTPSVGSADYPYIGITTTSVTGTGAAVSAGVNY